MLIVISPAKTLDYETPPVTRTHTKPELLKQSQTLINILRNYSALDLAELMHLSIKLAELNFERYHAWKPPFNMKNAKQAALAMQGDVYTGLDAKSLGEEALAFAQQHLRILSGLYGVLRPLDLMQAYRLEMGTRLPNSQGKDLYAFWGDTITRMLNKALIKQGDDLLINLASNEYFKSVRPKQLKGRIITPQFKEYKNGTLQDDRHLREKGPRPDEPLYHRTPARRSGTAQGLRYGGLCLRPGPVPERSMGLYSTYRDVLVSREAGCRKRPTYRDVLVSREAGCRKRPTYRDVLVSREAHRSWASCPRGIGPSVGGRCRERPTYRTY